MKLNSISFTGNQPTKKPLSKGQKVAIGAGVVAGAAVAAGTVACALKGKSIEPDAKLLKQVQNGFGAYKTIVFDFIAKTDEKVAKKAGELKETTLNFVSEKFPKKAQEAGKEMADAVKNAAEEVTEKVANA